MDTLAFIFGLLLVFLGWIYSAIKGIFDFFDANSWLNVLLAVACATYFLEKQIKWRFDNLQRQLDVLATRLTGRDTYTF
jgi:hypothetical protein